jgi:CheY-like chemotaxis protein
MREAASGSECLESLSDQQPDAILLDISMDEMDGWETAKAIRTRGYTDIPIIMVSANLFDNHADKLALANCQAFVSKPVLESELIGVLGRYLGIEWISAELSGVDLPSKFGTEVALTEESIPEVLREKMVQLLKTGHVQGLLNLLDSHAQHEPSHLSLTQSLRAMVLRFDFESLLKLTKRPHDD